MKFTAILVAVFFAALAFADSLVFDRTDNLVLNRGEERKQILELSPPVSGEPARLKLTWQKETSRYAEFKIPADSLPAVGEGIAEVRVFLEEGSRVGRIGLRLTDRKGETFQFYPLNATVNPGRWTVLSFRISENSASGSWDGNHDKKIDGDLRLTGVAVNFPAGAEAGAIFFDTLKLSASGRTRLACREEYLRFDRSELYSLKTSGGDASLKPGDHELTIFGQAAEHCRLTLSERKFAVTPLTPARNVVLRLNAETGSGFLRMSFRDSQGKLQSDRRRYVPGPQELVFTFPDSAAPAGQTRSLEIEPDAGAFRIQLNGAERVVLRSPADAVAFDVETGNPLHILREGEEDKLAFPLHNRSGERLAGRAQLEFQDFYGTTFQEAFDFDLAPGAVERHRLSRPLPARGIWYVNCRITTSGGGGEDVALSNRSFAWIRPSGPTPGRATGFLFGICSHPQRWSWNDQELEARAMAWCGAKVLRCDTGWNNIQPAPDRWDFSSMDRKQELFGRYNIELAPIWGYTAAWAASPEARAKGRDYWFRALPDYDAWAAFVGTMTTRYRGKIRFWEIWNEPDFSGSKFNSDEYAEMMKRAYQAAKKADPEAIVLSGGFATVKDHPSKKKDFHEEALVKGRGFFDVHAYHEHGRFATYRAVAESRFFPMRDRTRTAVPWYANETAINSLGGNEHLQAVTLFEKLIYSWGRGSIGYNWYDLRNDGFDAGNGEHNYGMVTNDFYPKAVYAAYNTLTGLYGNARFLRQLNVGEGLWAFLFAADGGLLVAGWNESIRGGTVPILLETDAKSAEIVDLMGNRRNCPVSNGVALLEIGSDPATLCLAGATKCEAAGSLIDVETLPPVLAGSSLPVVIRLRNVFSKPCEFDLKLGLPGGIQAEPAAGTVTVPAGQQASWRAVLRVSADFAPPPEQTRELTVRGTVLPGDLTCEMRLPLAVARKLPAGAMRDDAPDFRLERREQSVSLFDADPAKAHLVWQGREDRSALTWLRLENGRLQIRIDATDDKHVQPYSGVGVWRGDNVQLAMLLPGQDLAWEIGLTRLESGNPEVYLWSAPSGFDPARIAAQISLKTERKGTLTRYFAEIPLDALGVKAADLSHGIRFNMLVNDDDGEGREGWIQIAPGIGENKDPAKYPMIVF